MAKESHSFMRYLAGVGLDCIQLLYELKDFMHYWDSLEVRKSLVQKTLLSL
jgi:hypothetical protein